MSLRMIFLIKMIRVTITAIQPQTPIKFCLIGYQKLIIAL